MLFTVRQVNDDSGTPPVRVAPHGLRLRPCDRDPIELQHFGLDFDAAPAGHGMHRRDASGIQDEPLMCSAGSPAAARAWRLAS